MFSYELTCRHCKWRTICGPAEAASRLRLLGLFRRDADPDDDILATLIIESAPRMTCPLCKEKRLVAAPVDAVADDDSEWLAVVLCEVCREPVSPERLDAVPGVKRCAACQGKAEAGTLDIDEPDYCPQCGALTEVSLSRGGGITRYKRFCTGQPPCRL